ncbi:FAD/NAD(P)-binding protein [Rhizobium sp.]|jgi:uncharacterized NAD(P)/FAD-binding protein YdhS|uniref:FAD/NAD(P)-binding protein n=1 Tax=Rhizobium sp. TaxID=391 RepID=UPI000E7EC460|nr:hydroxyacylglutathione hydrolase [Rhizobium sp.]
MSIAPHQPIVAIVGGGLTGAVLAMHLAGTHASSRLARIIIFEPRDTLGAGLAYSTPEPTHRINVPADKMTVLPEDPCSFLRFAENHGILSKDPDAVAANGLVYLRRSAFGDYVAAQIQPYLDSGAIEHRKASVTAIERSKNAWSIQASDGSVVSAQVAAIAVSHPAPSAPSGLKHLNGHPKFVADATRDDALHAIENHDRVLIVGNGLTSADVVATLHARGHKGPIVAISRRGLRSRGHAATPQEPFGDFVSAPSVRASELVRRIRATVREAESRNLSWHAVLDAIRAQGQDIWRALSLAERIRLVRWARPFWDVHRFRIAPQVKDVLDGAIDQGKLSIRAGSVRNVVADENGFSVSLRERGKPQPTDMQFEAIVITTGPAHGGVLSSQPFLHGLNEAGVLTACETGLGIACDVNSVALGQDGGPAVGLFIAGPLARGTFGELMGVPQVTDHAFFVADQIADFLVAQTQAPASLSAG